MMQDYLHQAIESVRFPEERVRVAEIQAKYNFTGVEPVEWAVSEGLIKEGDITIAEVSPTYRCPEACPLCPDSSVLLNQKIDQGLATRDEVRASPELFRERVMLLRDFGVNHFMIIGGTVDHLPELPKLARSILDSGGNVSWFTDMITQIDEKTSQPSFVMVNNLSDGWLKQAATHVSMDYPFQGDLFLEVPDLPTKRGRALKFVEDGEYSRRFKSEYGAVGAMRLIENGVRRVVVNITVGPKNLSYVPEIYNQVAQLQDLAIRINSPTEVFCTYSPLIWRSQQARGASPIESPSSAGLQLDDMLAVNNIFSYILDDTYQRIAKGKPRLLANSSAFTNFAADSQFSKAFVDQALPYLNGKPEVFQVTPEGDIWLDPMFPGPELRAVNHTFGYRDRLSSRDKNPFVQFQPSDRDWFPNIVST